jgi:hypothetical protein
LRSLYSSTFTQSSPEIHLGDRVEPFLSCDVPQLQADCLIVDAGLELGGEIAADGGPDLFVELVVHVLVEHGGLADGRLADHAELDDYVLLHRGYIISIIQLDPKDYLSIGCEINIRYGWMDKEARIIHFIDRELSR